MNCLNQRFAGTAGKSSSCSRHTQKASVAGVVCSPPDYVPSFSLVTLRNLSHGPIRVVEKRALWRQATLFYGVFAAGNKSSFLIRDCFGSSFAVNWHRSFFDSLLLCLFFCCLYAPLFFDTLFFVCLFFYCSHANLCF